MSGRIAKHNLGLNAIFLDLTEQALADARAADMQLAAGETTRPLRGMLVAVKSNLNAKSQPTSNGLAALKDLIASDYSLVAANPRKAGAIIFRPADTPQLSMRLIALPSVQLCPVHRGPTFGRVPACEPSATEERGFFVQLI